mgnify:CR=1 FL=1
MAETLPMDEVALRGTYVGAQRRLTLMQPFDSSLGPVSVMVANDREDPFVEGVDELTPNALPMLQVRKCCRCCRCYR